MLVFRWVDSELFVHEELLGLYQTDSIKAATLLKIIKILYSVKLKAGNVSWAMELASAMSGIKNGAAKCISDTEP